MTNEPLSSNPVAQRLRALGQHPGMTHKGQHDCEDGVAEIERLTAELRTATVNNEQYLRAHRLITAERNSAWADRNRLRAALEHYNVPRAGGHCDCGKCDPGKVAREALAGVTATS